MIKVITDSTSYIPKSLIDELSIGVVPLSVNFKDESYVETEISNDDFFELMSTKNEIPTSSQPSVDIIYQAFKSEVEKGNDVVGVFISSKMSGTYNTAMMVRSMVLEEFPKANINVVDSESNCMQMGYAAIVGARAVREGLDINAVVSRINENIKRSRFIFMPDTLEYLKKGGRIGGASALIGSVLQIKPILTVKDGKTDVITKIRTRKAAIKKILEIVEQDATKHELIEIAVHHINDLEQAKKIKKIVDDKFNTDAVITDIGPVIGTHVGPGAVGVAYHTKSEILL